MNPLYILIALLAAPALVLMVLKVNAAMVFLSLCLGNVLVEFIGPDAGTMLASLHASVPGGRTPTQPVLNLGLLLLPVVLTTLFMFHTVKGAKLAFNILPAIGFSLLLSLLAVPLMSAGLTGSLMQLGLWHTLESLQTLLLGASALVCLLFLWMQRPKSHHDEGKHH